MSESLRIIPLGGVGEVGKNIPAIEVDGEILIVDCGLAFPEPDMLGIDLVIPDVTYLEERRDRVRGIILTHGHEDHTGALPYVLPRIPGTPIYATRLTEGRPAGLGLIAEFGRRGVEFLLSDSTRAERDGYTLSEATVGDSLHRLVGEAQGRVIVATFASNIGRRPQGPEPAGGHGPK